MAESQANHPMNDQFPETTEDWLTKILRELDLSQFYEALHVRLQLNCLEHFKYVRFDDLLDIGLSKPSARRLLNRMWKEGNKQNKSKSVISNFFKSGGNKLPGHDSNTSTRPTSECAQALSNRLLNSETCITAETQESTFKKSNSLPTSDSTCKSKPNMLEQLKVGIKQAVNPTATALSSSSSSTTTSTSDPFPVYNYERISDASTSASKIPSHSSSSNDYADVSEHLQQPEPYLNKLRQLHIQEGQSSPSKPIRLPSKPAPVPPPPSKPAPIPASLSKKTSIPRPPSESAPIPLPPTKSASIPPPLQTCEEGKGERAGYGDLLSHECSFNFNPSESPDKEGIYANQDLDSATEMEVKTAPSDSTFDDSSDDETPRHVYLNKDDASTNGYEKLNELSNNASLPQTSPQIIHKCKEQTHEPKESTTLKPPKAPAPSPPPPSIPKRNTCKVHRNEDKTEPCAVSSIRALSLNASPSSAKSPSESATPKPIARKSKINIPTPTARPPDARAIAATDTDRSTSKSDADKDLREYPWYLDGTRDQALERLKPHDQLLEEGSFVVRPTTHLGINEPYTLSLVCASSVRHIPIQRIQIQATTIEADGKVGDCLYRYSFGTDQPNFGSIGELVRYYLNHPIANAGTDRQFVLRFKST